MRTEHLLNFAFFMDDLLPTAEGDVPALRNCLGFGPGWGQSGGHRWKWEFCPGKKEMAAVNELYPPQNTSTKSFKEP